MSVEQRPARRRRTINNDDLKDGGGDGGMQMGGGEGMAPQGGGRQEGGRQRPAAPAQNNTRPQQQVPNTNDSTIYAASGTWQYTIDSPQGGGGVITLNKTGEGYGGAIRNDRRPEEVALENVSVNGNEVMFTYPATFGGNTMTVSVRAQISNDVMQGTMSMGETRTFNLSAKKTQ